ncbi:hypothetical protein [Streptomyces sp. AK02-01A]|uniref:hypothetical protein n=1 Tax=Streptomyces sp. AK02-01A TaxID=3028648 RepID=UPI0029AF5C6F|nr:hypothetical protein [Streptomyces sp. AK02-01A]MDX3854850.1 hypothetical protein [Streptomyces sp. AK02-01A]
MRLPRLLLAGILLFAAVFLLTGLLAQPPYGSVGATATAVFVPLWYCLMAVNAALGVAAGYRRVEEAAVFLAVFGAPAAVALVTWWISHTEWDGGPLVTTGRTPVMLAAGVALWAAVELLVALLVPPARRTAKRGTSVSVFLPLWLMVSVANLLLGVLAAGYTLAEEIPILAVDLLIPTAVAVLVPMAARRVRRERRTETPPKAPGVSV